MKEVLFSSAKEDWETPDDLFKELDDEFCFDLDACANFNNKKCLNFISPVEDALKVDWNGEVIWCNPPYGRKMYLWIKKAFLEWNKGKTIVLLLPARTDTKWFHEFIYPYFEIRFIEGRLRFKGAKYLAPFPSMIVVMN